MTHSVDDETVDAAVQRITDTIQTNEDLSLVVELDHAANAATVGLELPPMVVVFFGNPAAGTPLIQESLTAGLDLPQRMLVFEDEGVVRVSYNDPAYVANRHGIEGQGERLGNIRDALETIATSSDILLAVNGEGSSIPQAVGLRPTTARLPDRSWDIYALQLLAC